MKKAKKVKESDSLSSATVDTINLNPNDPAVQAAKAADDASKAADLLAAHTVLEEKAETFAKGFRPIFQKARDAYQKLEAVRGTAREYVQANLETLTAIRKFFASNKARRNKTTLGGCLTFQEYALKNLMINDDYVRECFRESTKQLPEKTGGTQGVQENDEEENIPVQVSAGKFADNLQMRIIKEIDESSYSQEDKMKICRKLLTHLTEYAQGVRLSLTPDEPKEAPASGNAFFSAQAGGAQ